MTRILVTNDDGVGSAGIHALATALERLGRVTIVAPTTEASAIGHALTLRRPLRVERTGERVYAVDGTPTDCVNIAVSVILDGRPDLVVSGINKGWNIGDDITYSGTVAGAMEGVLLGIPSLAVSLQRSGEPFDFGPAASVAAGLAELVRQRGLPPRTFLNVNVPHGTPRGVRVTVQARRNHVTSVSEHVDPRGVAYYWVEEGHDTWETDERSDHYAVREGFVSVTPLHPDLTNQDALGEVGGLVSAFTEARTGVPIRD